ncbi:MAG: hypothetical protein JWQ46_234 [Phenylobacterium sp.]|nr:hypothetical protein [Phenylobacterium sp.]
MSDPSRIWPVRIWIEASHHTAFGCGGWAFVRAEGAALSGVAGGERHTRAERMGLAGLAAALQGLPKSATLEIHTSDAVAAGVARRIAGIAAGEDPPTEDLDLWAQITAALKDRQARVLKVAVEPRTPGSFAAAWAELARDKAKATGPFASAIPKPNLAKAWVDTD